MAKRARSVSDRVTLDVGGSLFYTSKSTLSGGSSYFSRNFSDEWQGMAAEDDPIFLDRDADAFRALLSCLRAGRALLPTGRDLAVRLLLEAEYFGADAILNDAKLLAMKNINPTDESKQTIEEFEESLLCFFGQ